MQRAEEFVLSQGRNELGIPSRLMSVLDKIHTTALGFTSSNHPSPSHAFYPPDSLTVNDLHSNSYPSSLPDYDSSLAKDSCFWKNKNYNSDSVSSSHDHPPVDTDSSTSDDKNHSSHSQILHEIPHEIHLGIPHETPLLVAKIVVHSLHVHTPHVEEENTPGAYAADSSNVLCEGV